VLQADARRFLADPARRPQRCQENWLERRRPVAQASVARAGRDPVLRRFLRHPAPSRRSNGSRCHGPAFSPRTRGTSPSLRCCGRDRSTRNRTSPALHRRGPSQSGKGPPDGLRPPRSTRCYGDPGRGVAKMIKPSRPGSSSRRADPRAGLIRARGSRLLRPARDDYLVFLGAS